MIYKNDALIHKYSEYNGVATNNYAEYRAVVLALGWCVENLDASSMEIKLYSDNELVIKQLNGEYKLKSAALKKINSKVKELSGKLDKIEFMNVRREDVHISAVDRALNHLLDEMHKSKKI